VGADAYNMSLSDRRAKAVFDYLSSRGVDRLA
jgi:outer membrane protein OmpA-like peptidoglycan-associated protein